MLKLEFSGLQSGRCWMVKCKVCEKEFETDRKLHAHLKAHKMKMVEYYHKYEPRKDLFSGEFIEFKSKDFYFSNDFNCKNNMRNWLKKQPKKIQKEYLLDLLQKRKEKHKIKYTPSEVELRSVTSPPLSYYNSVFGDYYQACAQLKFKNKYEYPLKPLSYKIKKGFKIFIDTREQQPLEIDYPTEIRGLKFGDYALNDPENKCYIERKSIKDFIGTLSGGYERFCREIERAIAAKAHLVVMVENSLSECLDFNHVKEVFKKTQVTPEYIFFHVREIIQKYPEVQFLFVKDRKESVKIMKKIFFCESEFKNYDLQLMYNLNLL